MSPLFQAFILLSSVVATTPAKHEAKVVIIGVDGVSLNLLEPYIEQGVTRVFEIVSRAQGYENRLVFM